MGEVQFILKPIPPFSLHFTAWVLRRRPSNLVDQFSGGAYTRVLAINRVPLGIRIVQKGTLASPELDGVVLGRRIAPQDEEALLRDVRKILGLDFDMSGFYSMSARYPKLDALAHRFRGMKPPRFPSIFEALANAIACQQVSIDVGLLLVSRLSQRYGAAMDLSGRRISSFPTADALSQASPLGLRSLGFSNRKAEYLSGLAKSVSAGLLDLEELHGVDNEEAIESLMQIRGVGRWSAEYTLLRGLGRLDVFPGDDVGGQNSLKKWMGLRMSPNYDRVQNLLDKWRRFRGLLYFHLLLKGLQEKGTLGTPVNSYTSQNQR